MTPNPRTNSHKDSKGNSMTLLPRIAESLAYWLIEIGDALDSAWLTPPFIRAGTALYRMAEDGH